MDRRQFTLGTGLAAVAGIGLTPMAQAQAALVEGRDYVRLAQPVAMPATGKIEVVEFFGYWCPHCNSFEPALEAWIKTLPADVDFRRVPVAFTAAHEPYQRIYFALEALGLVETMQRKVFAAIHVGRKRLDKEADILALMTANGVDAAKFSDAFKSFSVQAKVRQARQLSDAYKIDGVPTLGVHGRFFTSPSLTGGHERALAVANELIQRVRKG